MSTATAEASLAERLASLPSRKRSDLLSTLSDTEIRALSHDWQFRARPKQLPPGGDWFVWLLLGGRGFGKTRAGAGWIHQRAMSGDSDREMMMVGRTPSDVRDTMVEGPGGLLKNVPPWEAPEYEPANRHVTWPTGARALIRSGANPKELRGFSGDTAWCDEFASWKYPKDAWNNLVMGMREAKVGDPKVCITTTPKPITPLKKLVDREWCRVVRGSSYENTHLSSVFFEAAIDPYEGTRLGRQEIHGEILDDVPGALWKRKWIEVRERKRGWASRMVVAVDPAVSKREDSSDTGIIGAGVRYGSPAKGHVYEDRSGKYSPNEWAHEVARLFGELQADAVVAEVNNGGDLVESNLRTVAPELPVIQVRASRGKAIRAEPVANLYEQNLEETRITHEPGLDALEDQLCSWDPSGSMPSPDRLDALVWAFTELMLGETYTAPEETVYDFEEAGGFVL